jgi:hypothetical protein
VSFLHLHRDSVRTGKRRLRLNPRNIPCTGSKAAGTVHAIDAELVAGRTGAVADAAGHVIEEGDHLLNSFTITHPAQNARFAA